MVFSGHRFVSLLAGALLFAADTLAFDNSRSDNVAVYWGQNSYGATHTSDTANWQKTLSTYCQDSSIDAIPIAFLNVFFSTGGLPEINLSNICSATGTVFPGTSLANCQSLAADIQACQAKGKIVTLSLGGATGAASFSSDAQAQTFADTVWNLFLGGSSSTRPFGNAILDGVDLDIEGGGSTGFAAFVTRIRSHASGASKPYYVTAAPQCPYPDAYLGAVLNAVGFDAVYVQYNNYCGLQGYGNANAWNFAQWDTWAKTISPNRNVKIYIGAPASSTSAGSGYVDVNTLGTIALATKSQYSSFGGVMLWDASQAFANGRYDSSIKNLIAGGTTAPPPTTAPTTTTTAPPTTTSPSSGSCVGVTAWSSTSVYIGGAKVTYNGHLWTAKWWTQGDTPGSAVGVWTDNGTCTAAKGATAALSAGGAAASAKATGASAKSASPAPSAGASKATAATMKSSRFFRLE